MTIVVQCPHCETKFNLQPDLNGKSMRCPNLQCRKVFTARAMPRPVDPPPVPPEPLPLPDEDDNPRKGSRLTSPAKAKKPSNSATTNKPQVAEFEVVDAEVIEAAVVASPKVKEVVWSEGADLPAPKSRKSKPRPKDDTDDLPIIRRRKKKKNIVPLLLIGGVVLIVLIAGGTGLKLLYVNEQTEKQASDKAEEQYTKGDFAQAQKSFEKLAAEYPDGENTPRYKFFAELCDLQKSVRDVTTRDNPDDAIGKFKKFAEANKKSDFAKPAAKGKEILDAGEKLTKEIAAHADDRVKAYRADRINKSSELERADKTIVKGREFLTLVDTFRPSSELPPVELRKEFDRIQAEIAQERFRTATLAKASGDLKNISDAAILKVEEDLTLAGLLSDPDAQAMIAAAKNNLGDLVRYEAEPEPVAPTALPPAVTATQLYVSPIGKTETPLPPAMGDPPPSVFLAVARGVLYAIEENSGAQIWAVRIGQEIADPPTTARVDLDEGPIELAIVTSNVAGQSAIASYILRNGVARWYQPLPAPAAGPVVVVGTRAFVPVRDALGSIYEFDLITGYRKGRIRIGQPAGPGAVVRPGTGLVYVAADARRVYVINVSMKDENTGALRPPQCVQVIATGHQSGTLRTPPVLLGPEGKAEGERWMIFSQADGPNSMKLRAFSLQSTTEPAPDAKLPPEIVASPLAELPLRGWTWFPPTSDGERLAAVTDSGQLRIFEVKQPGNFDKVLFPLPEPKLPSPPEGTPVRGIVFPAEESAFWVLANGNLQKYRLGLVPSRGVELLPVGTAISIGEATQPAQLNNKRNSAFLVVRSRNSDGCKGVLISLREGGFRWQRQLGVVPAVSPIPQGEFLLLVAKDGGLTVVPKSLTATPGPGQAVPASWLIASPPQNVSSPTAVAISSDGKTVYSVTQTTVYEDLKWIPKYLVRRIVDGKVEHEGSVNAPPLASGVPAPLAGPPAVLGETLVLPLANGFVYRHVQGRDRSNPDSLVAGPPWPGDQRIDSTTRCYITPLSATAFLTTDGSKKISRWEWPTGGQWNPSVTWELRDQPAGPGLLLPPDATGAANLLMADISGSVWLFPNDRGGEPLRRWQPGKGLPSGKPTSALVMQRDAGGKPVVAYTVEDKIVVCLNPEQAVPLQFDRTGDEFDGMLIGSPQPLGEGKWAITDLGGHITLYDSTSAKAIGSIPIGLPGAVPAVAGTALNSTSLLMPLLDGSTVVLPLP